MYLQLIFKNKNCFSFVRFKSYKNTLNNPNFSLTIKPEIVSDASNIYDSLHKYLKESDLNRSFILHDGPPYANGDAHVGHALNKIIKDVTAQYKRLKGYSVDFRPGWDCHGLPIEMKSIDIESRSPINIRSNAKKIANQYIDIQKSSFKSWAVSANWDNYYTTHNFNYQSREIQAFNELCEKQLVFRAALPTFWSFSSRTALAEAELEYNDNHCSDSLFVTLKLVPNHSLFSQHDNVSLLIWTTTPWTLVANEAVGFRDDIRYLLCQIDNSERKLILAAFALDKIRQITNNRVNVLTELYGSDLNGCQYFHPIIQGKICSAIQANFITEDKGTGLIHIAPAHGKEDFQLLKSRGEYQSVFVTDNGTYTNICGEQLVGLDVLKTGSEKTISILGSNIFHRDKLIHSYPYDWRTKQPVIIRLSRQWFIDIDKLSDKAMSEYQKVNVFPPVMKNAMHQFIKNRPNWCISRQRKWGVPIPIIYHHDKREIIDKEFINYVSERIEKEGSDFWWCESVTNIVPKKYLQKWQLEYSDLKMSEDIFDIWFDSGLSWWCSLSPSIDNDVYIEGIDQFRGWFSSSLLTGVALKGSSPYRNLVCHGFTTDNEGRKMSKSLGNVLNPLDIIQKYGVDVLRYWACSSGLNSNTQIGHSLLEQMSKKYFSLRNMFRFLLGNISKASTETFENIFEPNVLQSLLPQDRYILHVLKNNVQKIENSFENYQYDLVVNALEELDSKISNFYFTMIKDRLYCESVLSKSHKSCLKTLMLIFNALVSVGLPIFPCLTLESIEAFKKSNILREDPILQWPRFVNDWIDDDLGESFENVILPLRENINNIKFSDYGIILSNKTNPMSELSLEIFLENKHENHFMEILNNHSADWETCSSICEVFRCAAVKISDISQLKGRHHSISNSKCLIEFSENQWVIEFTKHSVEDKCARCRRYTNIGGNTDCCSRCQGVIDALALNDSQIPCQINH